MKPTFLSILLLASCGLFGQSKFEKNLATSREYVHKIRSLDSEEFADLAFLKEETGEKRIVWLGENDHRIRENNVLKLRLIKFLHQEMGYDVVLFESGAGNVGISNLAQSQLNPFEFLYTSLLGAWRTKENCALMEYFKLQELELAGMDPNFKARYLPKRAFDYILRPNPEMAEQYYLLDSINSYLKIETTKLYHSRAGKKTKSARARILNIRQDSIKSAYEALRNNMLVQDINPAAGDEKARKIIRLGLNNTIADLSGDLTKFRDPDSFFINSSARDSLMAANITYLADSVYPNEKIIVWAHNGHIKKVDSQQEKPHHSFKTMHEYLPERLKRESFVIGLYADSKQAAARYSVINIGRKLAIGSFYLNTRAYAGSDYLDIRDFWTYSSCRRCGIGAQSLAESYDALIFIPDAQRSVLLNIDPYKQ